eukprot:8855083-Ditylum_brightwellii.AAC.1
MDYTLETYTDVIRLNKKLFEVGVKISDHLSNLPKNHDILRIFISNMCCLQDAIKELSDLTKDLDNPISDCAEMNDALEKIAASFSKLQNIFPTASFTLKADHSIGQEDVCIERNMASIDNPKKLVNMATLVGHSGEIRSLATFESKGSTCLVSSSHDKTIKIWDVENEQLVGTLQGHSDGVRSIAVFDHKGTTCI